MATPEEKKSIVQNESNKSREQNQGTNLFQYMDILVKESFNVLLYKKNLF